MGRYNSIAIRLLWTEEQIKTKSEQIVNVITKVLKAHQVTA